MTQDFDRFQCKVKHTMKTFPLQKSLLDVAFVT